MNPYDSYNFWLNVIMAIVALGLIPWATVIWWAIKALVKAVNDLALEQARLATTVEHMGPHDAAIKDLQAQISALKVQIAARGTPRKR